MFIILLLLVVGKTREEAGGPTQNGVKGEASAPFTIRAATLKGPSGFGMIRMFEEALELGKNVAIEFQVLPTPQEMVVRVAGGEFDFAVFPANMGAKLYTAGPGYKLGAVVGFGMLSVVSTDPSIMDWTDLKGRTVRSIGKGATPEYLFRYIVSQNGLDPETDLTVDFSVKSAPQLAQLLISGKAETAILPEPFVTAVRLKSNGKALPVLNFQEEWNRVQGADTTYPMTVVVVKPSLAGKHPGVVRRFLDACRRSIEWVNANPAEAARLIEKFDILSAALAEPAIPNCNLRYLPAEAARPFMEAYLSVLLDINPDAIGGKLPDDDFYFRY